MRSQCQPAGPAACVQPQTAALRRSDDDSYPRWCSLRYADDNDLGTVSNLGQSVISLISQRCTAQYNNQTIREIVHTSVGGNQVRVRISNTFGSAPLVIGEAHVAVTSSGSSIVPGTDRALTFGGRTSVTIPAGAPAVSDPVDLHVQPVSDIAVSLYLPHPTKGETTTFFQGTSYRIIAWQRHRIGQSALVRHRFRNGPSFRASAS